MNNKIIKSFILILIIVCMFGFTACKQAEFTKSVGHPSAMPTESAQKAEQEIQIYNDFLKSNEWRKVNFGEGEFVDEDAKIESKKIFDFDGDGVKELWMEALNGLSEISIFCTIVDGEVEILLSGYVSGGTIGGDTVVFGYDKKAQKQVVGLSGYAGGFGGRYNWGEYYSFESGELNKCISFSKMLQVEEDYSEEELEGIHYIEKESPFESSGLRYITVYKVNEKQVSKKAYKESFNNYIECAGPSAEYLTKKDIKAIKRQTDARVKTIMDSSDFGYNEDYYYDGDILAYKYFEHFVSEENFAGYHLYFDAQGKLIFAEIGHYRDAHYSIYFYNDELLCTEPETLAKRVGKIFLSKDISLCLEYAY